MKKNNLNKAKQIYNLMLKKLCKYYSIRVRSSVAQEYGIKIWEYKKNLMLKSLKN